MTKEELLYRFDSVMDKTISVGNKDDMETSRAMFRKLLSILYNMDTRKSVEFMECFEGNLEYNNYVSKDEALRITSSFVNYNGTKGAYFGSPEEMINIIEDMDKEVDLPPYYNEYALYVTMNMYASDQGHVIRKWVGDDKSKFIEACFDLASNQLKDVDRPAWIHEYFKV